MAEDSKANEIMQEIAKDVYADVGHPIAKPTGELVGLVPRAIKAALAPVEKWVLQREYNVAETQKLLEEKLKNVSPNLIEPPDAHIAVPALQYISYCMDNDELRNMYANLLANSMNKIVKNGVHPSFVEIIKQMSPDEAKIMRYFSIEEVVPTISVRIENDKGEGKDIKKDFSNVGEIVSCEKPFDTKKYFDNLVRLGLLERAPFYSYLVDKDAYEQLKTHNYLLPYIESVKSLDPEKKITFRESYVTITDFGKAFCEICIANITLPQAE